jgi:hypothetical protein
MANHCQRKWIVVACSSTNKQSFNRLQEYAIMDSLNSPAGEACFEIGADPARLARARALLQDDEFYYYLAETFRALSDTTRTK